MQRESEARAAKSNCSSFARLGPNVLLGIRIYVYSRLTDRNSLADVSNPYHFGVSLWGIVTWEFLAH